MAGQLSGDREAMVHRARLCEPHREHNVLLMLIQSSRRTLKQSVACILALAMGVCTEGQEHYGLNQAP